MSGETCRHCGDRIEYVDKGGDGLPLVANDPWWRHADPFAVHAWDHEAAPAFGGAS